MEKEGFSDDDIIFLLQGLLDKNGSGVDRRENGTNDFVAPSPFASMKEQIPLGMKIYASVTPLIIVLGLVGNILSLVVYVAPRMRQLGICIQLAAVSVSDSAVLVLYVLPEWLSKGLPVLGRRAVNVIHIPGACQCFLFFSYSSRAFSAWLLASFSIQQCALLYGKGSIRKWTTSRGFAVRLVFAVLVVAILGSLYKPILNGVNPEHGICHHLPGQSLVNFVLDVIYGLSISVVPCLLIALANAAILVFLCRKRNHGVASSNLESNHGFVVTIIATTLTYIFLNVPYFIVWVKHYVLVNDLDPTSEKSLEDIFSQHFRLRSLRSDVYLTRLLFYFNFAIKALLYSITAKRFRHQMVQLCKGQGHDDLEQEDDVTMATLGTGCP